MWTPDLVCAVRVDDMWCLYAGASVQVRVSGLQLLQEVAFELGGVYQAV